MDQARGRDDGGETLFDFNRFVPYPEEWERMDREREGFFDRWRGLSPAERENATIPPDGFNSGGYEWCVENWGTKWNACGVQIGERSEWTGDVSQDLHFETAWSPPEPVIKRAAELFPDLTFTLRYFERGAAYNGMLRCEGGEVTFDESGPYFGSRGG
ncbi:MAG: hypothetical protein K2X87_01710 [Gemmataceae bacterium]|nr:hypothetical protein [Gemmataceae bacterium]